MRAFVNRYLRPAWRKMGVDLVPYKPLPPFPTDFEPQHQRILTAVKPYTATGPERIYCLIEAVKYLVANRIPGAFVECGVWRGGSTMVMALTLLELGVTDRDLYLYDTFAGMPTPTAVDVDLHGRSAFDEKRAHQNDTTSSWAPSPLDEVRANLARTGYPAERFHYVQGKVEETIPATQPDPIALLRLDTDWYESTRHELEHLYPLLSTRGVLLVDDYGHWQGARQATDEYFAGRPLLLNRIDYSGRIAVKPSA